MRTKILLGFALLHITLMALYAAHFAEWGSRNTLTKTTSAIGDFTNSNAVYSFFAPYIGEQVNVIYTVVDSAGLQTVHRLPFSSREIENRVNTIYNFLYMSEAHLVLCRSFAEQVFQLFPKAHLVRVHVIKQSMPTMAAFKNGEKTRWETLFFKDFERVKP
jgi:hypothetical protein